MFSYFAEKRGADLDRLERQVKLAVQSRRDLSGDLKFLASGKKAVDLSRSMVIALDEALSVAQALNQSTIDTDHLLGVMTSVRSARLASDPVRHQKGALRREC